MTPYWVIIEHGLGVGVTARSEADARELFDAAFGRTTKFLGIKRIADMRELEQKHVVPNSGNWFQRGIWFPLGHEPASTKEKSC